MPYVSIDEVANLALMVTVDIELVYRLIPVHPQECPPPHRP